MFKYLSPRTYNVMYSLLYVVTAETFLFLLYFYIYIFISMHNISSNNTR